MEFLCEEEGFPFPAEMMKGGWEILESTQNSCEVQIWWELKPKPPYMAPLILPLLGMKADMDFPAIVYRMGGIGKPTDHRPWPSYIRQSNHGNIISLLKVKFVIRFESR